MIALAIAVKRSGVDCALTDATTLVRSQSLETVLATLAPPLGPLHAALGIAK